MKYLTVLYLLVHLSILSYAQDSKHTLCKIMVKTNPPIMGNNSNYKSYQGSVIKIIDRNLFNKYNRINVLSNKREKSKTDWKNLSALILEVGKLYFAEHFSNKNSISSFNYSMSVDNIGEYYTSKDLQTFKSQIEVEYIKAIDSLLEESEEQYIQVVGSYENRINSYKTKLDSNEKRISELEKKINTLLNK